MRRNVVWCCVLFVLMRVCAVWASPASKASPVMSIAFSADSRLLASGAQNGDVTLWSVPALQAVRVLKGHRDGVTSLVFSRDGHTLYAGSMDRLVKVFSVDSGKEIASLGPHTDDVLFIALSPDEKRLAASSYDGATVVWDLQKRDKLPFRMAGHTVDWSPDGKLISTASIDGTIHLYTPDGKQVASWKGHAKCPNVARFSPNGQLVASCVDHVKLWDAKTHALKADVDARIPRYMLSSVVWSPDGQHMLAATQLGGGARLDLKNGRWDASPLAPGTNVQAAAFSANGKLIAIANLSGTVELLDASTGRRIAMQGGRAPIQPRVGH